MLKVHHLDKDQKGNEPSLSAEGAAGAIRAILAALPTDDRERVLRELGEMIRSIPAPQAGKVLGKIVEFLPKKKEWTVTEIKGMLVSGGVEATHKEVYNSLGYLSRKGHIKKIGYGRYLISGILLVTADDLHVEPSKYED
jgi:hypothetical protein